MTRLAVLSDIHANLPALSSVLEDLDERIGRGEVDGVYCLGDLVGYAPWPNEVVREIRRRGIPTLAGNYDEGVGLESDDCGCAYRTEADRAWGAKSISFTNDAVTDTTRAYLRGLPRHIRLTFARASSGEPPIEVVLVHGSPRRVNEYLFADRPEASFLRIMEGAGADILLFGHTHLPFHQVLEPGSGSAGPRFRHAINTGSVGKPKDGDPRAGYVLIEIDRARPSDDAGFCSSELVRVEYDVEAAARAIEKGPLPDAFAAMLREAR